jgi:hypothetical protein
MDDMPPGSDQEIPYSYEVGAGVFDFFKSYRDSLSMVDAFLPGSVADDEYSNRHGS